MFLVGLACGIAAGVGRIYWIGETLVNYGGLNQIQALVSTVALVFYLALYPALFFLICRSLPLSSTFFSWLAASVWVLLDWAQSWILTGFPWQQIGYSQHGNLSVLQFASVAGIYGLSFALVLVNSAVTQAILVPRRLPVCAGPVLLGITGLLAYGNHRLAAIPSEPSATAHARVAVIQGSIPQGRKVEGGPPAAYHRSLHRTDAELPGGEPRRKLRPDRFSGDRPPLLPDRPGFRRVQGAGFGIGAPTGHSHPGRQPRRPKRSSGPCDLQPGLPDGQEGRTHRFRGQGTPGSIRRVPAPPAAVLLPRSAHRRKRTVHTRGLASGTGTAGRGISDPASSSATSRFFPGITRTLALDGANLLINTTNDAWFGYTSAPYQHMAMAAVRAVETGLPLVRAANTGISGGVAPNGRVLVATELFPNNRY